MLPIPIEYLNSVCEIKTMENGLIAAGVIAQIEEDYVQINEKNGFFPLLSYGTMLKVNIFNSKIGFRVIIGSVLSTSIRFIKLVDVSSLLDYERRNFFRIETDQPACLVEEQPDGSCNILCSIIVRDLSLGGVLFETDLDAGPFSLEQRISLKLKLTRMSLILPLRIKRIIPDNGKKSQYGCEFDGISDAQTDAICTYIFQRQRERLNKAKNVIK